MLLQRRTPSQIVECAETHTGASPGGVDCSITSPPQVSAPLPRTSLSPSPGVPKTHKNTSKTHLKIRVRTGSRKSDPSGAEAEPRWAKVGQRSPKWSPNGGPGPSGTGPERRPGPKRRHVQFSYYLLCFSHIGRSREPPFWHRFGIQKWRKTGFRTDVQKSPLKSDAGDGKMAPLGSTWRPKDTPRASK